MSEKRRSGRAGKAAALSPETVKTRLAEAAQHRVDGRYDEAVALYESVEQANPEALDAPYFIALIELARGRTALALPRLLKLSRRAPKLPDVWEAVAYTRRELGQWREAAEASRRVLALQPERIDERLNLVGALEVLGKMDEAIGMLRAMIDADQGRLAALIHLARMKPDAVDASGRAQIATAASDAERPAEARANAYFSLGAAMERARDYDASFDAFADANRIKRALLAGELEAEPEPAIGPAKRALPPAQAERESENEIGQMKAIFTPAFMAQHEGQGHHLAAPIFILGMPRSGSTLIEQILSSHPKVQGLGETGALWATLRGAYPYKLTATEQPNQFRRLAEGYLAAMHDRGWTSASRFVDKMLRNFLYVGAIHLMFPKAVILHTRRDPVDTCLANFRQNFATGNELSYDLADIGREYVRYRDAMDYWEALLPGRVTHVDHEALVADPDSRIRWLVTEACGLAWDEACLNFHQTRRAVRTASVAQVRQPIFTTSVQRWRRYASRLGPLFDALGPYAPADLSERR